MADSVPGSIGGNPILPVGTTVYGSIEEAGDQDWFQVTVVAGEHYFVSLSGDWAPEEWALSDPHLHIYNSDGVEVTADDDSGSGLYSFIDWVPTESGTYYIDAQPHTSGYIGDYILSIAQDIPQDTGTAMSLTVGEIDGPATAATGHIDADPSGVDDNWYAVQLEAGGNYVVRVTGNEDVGGSGQALTNPVAGLYDSSGTLITQIDGTLYYTPTEAGTYYISAGGIYNTDSGYYDISIAQSSTPSDDPSHTPEGAIDWVDWTVPHTTGTTTEIKVFFAENGVSIHDHWYDPVGDYVYDYGTFTALGFNDVEMAAAEHAFAEYERFADVHFTVVTDIADADFVMAQSVNEGGIEGGLGYWDVGGNSQNAGATFSYGGTEYDVLGVGVFNADANDDGWAREVGDFYDAGSLAVGGYGYITMIHELGHGMGLAHPHDNGGDSEVMHGVDSAFYDYGDYDLDQGIFSVMSYNSGWDTEPGVERWDPDDDSPYSGWMGTMGALDIAKLQELYGAVEANTGDDTYALTDVQADAYYQCIWDTGGDDTIAYSGSMAVRIELQAATLQYSSFGGGVVSYVNGVHGGFTIANGVVIENASGGSGADTLLGNEVGNVLDGGAGSDFMAGLGGGDIYYVDDADDFVDESARTSGGIDTVMAALSFSLGDTDHVAGDVENLTLIAAAINGTGNALNNTITGNDVANDLAGQSGSDTINGGKGNDTLHGGSWSDELHGGANADLIYGDNGSDLIHGDLGYDQLHGGNGNDTIHGDDADDTLNGDAGNDQLWGDVGNDVAFGGAGNDLIGGGQGNDALHGYGDNDTLNGGAGNDTLTGDAGDDSLDGGANADDLSGGDGNDTLLGGVGYDTLSGGTNNDELHGGDQNDVLHGDANADLLYGDGGNDQLYGDIGYDTLHGGDGNDTLRGGDANDTLYGDAGNDQLWGEGGNDNIGGGAGNDEIYGWGGNDTVWAGSQNDYISGDGGNDNVHGEVGADTIIGGAGNDRLDGGTWSDLLTGGADHDTFLFASGFGHDTITDFDALDNNERIDLHNVSSIGDYADLAANHMSAVDANTVLIDDGSGNTITLQHVALADLGSGDFVV